ncbi:MAG: ABC transporter ATP-binding protein [Clostridia bacterium]|nr:ABC transporter ATP-binding protein [Clostridia bacterium]
MLKIENLNKIYLCKKALSDVNLTFTRGEIVGLFGENGAGKTTLMKCILGLHGYTGQITLDGEPITRKNIDRISFATSEHSFFPNLTPWDHRCFYKEHFPHFSDKRFEGLMRFFGLPMRFKPLRSFSTGQKNQFEVILALCQGADYILMDEPFAGNDLFNREDFYKVLLGILEPGETVILSTHLIEEVSGFIGRAVMIHEGKIVGDVTADELDESGKSLVAYVKETYGYRSDRVSRALDDIVGEDGE